MQEVYGWHVRQPHESQARTEAQVADSTPLPPPYTCTVQMSGVLGLKLELLSPFQASGSRDWCEVFVVLQGTQLSLHRVKNASIWSKKSEPSAGKLLNSYTLQHAEVGVASDFNV